VNSKVEKVDGLITYTCCDLHERTEEQLISAFCFALMLKVNQA